MFRNNHTPHSRSCQIYPRVPSIDSFDQKKLWLVEAGERWPRYRRYYRWLLNYLQLSEKIKRQKFHEISPTEYHMESAPHRSEKVIDKDWFGSQFAGFLKEIHRRGFTNAWEKELTVEILLYEEKHCWFEDWKRTGGYDNDFVGTLFVRTNKKRKQVYERINFRRQDGSITII